MCFSKFIFCQNCLAVCRHIWLFVQSLVRVPFLNACFKFIHIVILKCIDARFRKINDVFACNAVWNDLVSLKFGQIYRFSLLCSSFSYEFDFFSLNLRQCISICHIPFSITLSFYSFQNCAYLLRIPVNTRDIERARWKNENIRFLGENIDSNFWKWSFISK